jgi:hypothetical protein
MLLLGATMVGAVPTVALGQTQYHTEPLAPPLQRAEHEQRGGPAGPGAPPPQEGQSGTSTPTAPEGSLSNELSRSHGVIQPPPTGDQGVVPPPSPGTSRMPVIPPPGTPGGNPEVQPK